MDYKNKSYTKFHQTLLPSPKSKFCNMFLLYDFYGSYVYVKIYNKTKESNTTAPYTWQISYII